MIGRFLLGAGLGGAVSVAALAVVSLNLPPPVAQAEKPMAPVPEAAEVATDLANTPPVVDPAAAPESAPEPAPQAAEAEGQANTAAQAEPSVAVSQDQPEAEAPAQPPAEQPAEEPIEQPAEQAVAAADAPAEPAPEIVALDKAPDLAQVEDVTALPEAPSDPVVETPPEAAPEAPHAPGSDAPPQILEDAPPPPPLTPEEEELLRRVANEGPQALLAHDLPGVAPLAGEPLPPGAFVVLPPGTLVQPPVEPPEATETSEAAEAVDLAPEAAPAADEAQMIAPKPEPGIVADPPSRLPQIGDNAAPAAEASPELAEAEALPPLQRFARPFERSSGKPAFAIVLIDDGKADLDRAGLAALPFPISFAIDPQAPNAASLQQIYRDAGQEVVMLATGLPKGATAQDVEVAFSVMEAALPEAVAVMDLAERRFQGDRAVASLVVPVIAAQGRGLVTWNEGLNAADQLAKRDDLPSAAVFRALDSGGESIPVIRRYLDRAAFKALQENKVLVVGQAKPETVSALLEWTVEGRAATVSLAPVSAVLSKD